MTDAASTADFELVDRLKTNLSSFERRVELRDLVLDLLPVLVDRLTQLHDEYDFSQLTYQEKFALYDEASDAVCTAAAFGGFWSEDPHTRPWIEFFEALGDLSSRYTERSLDHTEAVLPLHLAFYHFGVTAVESGHLQAVGQILSKARVPVPEARHAFVRLGELMYSRWGSGERYFPERRYQDFTSSVMSRLIWQSRLFARIRPFFVSDALSQSAFLLFEGILAVEATRLTVRDRRGTLDGTWVPAGLWAHERLPITAGRETAIEWIRTTVEADGDQSPYVQVGIGGSKDELLAMLDAINGRRVRVG